MKRKIEWKLLGIFALGLIIWMNWVYPFIQGIAVSEGSFTAFLIYLVLLLVISNRVGDTFKMGLESMIVFLLVVVGLDVVTPPYLLNISHSPTPEVLNMWGADTFLYQLFGNFTANHLTLYLITYIAFPIASVFILSWLLGKRAFKRTGEGAIGIG